MNRVKRSLEEVLVSEKFISEEQLKTAAGAAKTAGRSLENILFERNLISEEGLARAKGLSLGVPYIKLSDAVIDYNIAHMISDSIAKKHSLIPVKLEGNTLYVAMVTPSDLAIINEIKLMAGCEIQPVITSRKEIQQAINKYFKVEETSRQALVEMRMEDLRAPKRVAEKEDMRELEKLPVVKLMNNIILSAINRKASDIHFEPQDPEMQVRYRVDGILYDIMSIPGHIEPAVISRLKIMAKLDITETRRPQDGHITFKRGAESYDFRMSSVRTINGEKVVLRVLDREAMLIGLERLGFTRHDKEIFKSFIRRPFGMILVTGPTGSGKTTTLYSVLRQLELRNMNIITIENPVEYKLDGINQIQVNPGVGLTFATGLRTILRQDPDVILVGEIRDKETAEIAIHAALTGHLVFSTLHTNDAPSVFTRLIDMGVEPFLISATVIGCIAQRLCRTICPECATEYEAAEEEMKIIRELSGEAREERMMLKKGSGCDFCLNMGLKGRQAVFEVLKMSEAIRRLVVSSSPLEMIRKTAIKEGMKTLQQNGIQKIIDGVSTVEEIRRVVYVEE